MPNAADKPKPDVWEKPTSDENVRDTLDQARAGSPRAQEGVRFILDRALTGGALPQPYADLLDSEFWDGLPTEADLRRHGLGRGYGLSGLMDEQPDLPARMDFSINMFALRDVFIGRYAFAVPSRETLECIARNSRNIVELNAGTGFWARLLAKLHVDIVATDLKQHLMQNGQNFEVIDLDGRKAVERYPDRDVLTCWPHMDASWLTQALSRMQPGRLLFFIGEGEGGCTGHGSTHRALNDTRLFEPVEVHSMIQFSGIHDDLYIFKRTDRPWKKSGSRRTR